METGKRPAWVQAALLAFAVLGTLAVILGILAVIVVAISLNGAQAP